MSDSAGHKHKRAKVDGDDVTAAGAAAGGGGGAAAAGGASERPRPVRIAIEGNIAAGKSTYLTMLGERFGDFSIVQEPVHKWTSVQEGGSDTEDSDSFTNSQKSGGNLLGLFYQDSERWAYTFQTYAFLSRMKSQMRHDETSTKPVTIFERSVISDRVCFAKNCNASGVMSDMEYNIYCDFHSFITSTNSGLDIDAIVYLQTTPEVCMSRLKMRNREEEEGVPLDYLKTLHTCHEEWLIDRSVDCPGFTDDIPVLTLDCNVDFKENAGHLEKLLEQTKTFVDSVKRRS